MVRWWRLALLVLAGVVTAAAAAVLAVAANVATGGTAPRGFRVDGTRCGGSPGRRRGSRLRVAGVGGAAVGTSGGVPS